MSHTQILCFDGGGIRGLITALLVQDLDKKYGIVEKAHGFAGTSTGGLIALGLASGKRIEDIVELYKNSCDKLFQKNPYHMNLKVVTNPTMYLNKGFASLARELLGETPLKDAKKFVMVNTARLWLEEKGSYSWSACVMSSKNEYKDVKMRDAALATSAAPSYFPPYRITVRVNDQVKDYGYFIDGGVFANNPSVSAISETIEDLKVRLEDLRILSLGTGVMPQGIAPKAFDGRPPEKWGTASWMWPTSWSSEGVQIPSSALINLIFDCGSQAGELYASQLLKKRYHRINVPLTEPVALDGCGQIDKLEAMTKKFIESDKWQDISRWIRDFWV